MDLEAPEADRTVSLSSWASIATIIAAAVSTWFLVKRKIKANARWRQRVETRLHDLDKKEM